jgi:hypothetical protein
MSLTKVTYSMITGATVNVLDYGAFNDNTNAAATTAAIQAAIDTGKNVFLPEGTYLINAALTVFSAGQIIFGESFGNTSIVQTTVGENGIEVNNKQRVQIRNLKLSATGSNTKAALYVTGSAYSTFSFLDITGFNYGVHVNEGSLTYYSELFIINTRSHGMYISGPTGACVDTTVMRSYIGGSGQAGAAHGVYIEGQASGVYFTKVDIYLSSGYGIFMETGTGPQPPNAGFFNQCIIDQNTAGGVRIDDGLLFEFNNCWTSGASDGYWFDTSMSDARIIGGQIFNMGSHGVKIKGTRCSVVGTNIRGSGTSTANTFDGVRIEGATAALVSGVNFDGDYNSVDTTRYGVSIQSGGANNCYITGCTFTNMASGEFIDEGGSTANNRFLNQYQSGSVSIANTATATLYTFPSQVQGNYLFFCGQAGNTNGGIRAMAYVRVGSASLAVTSIVAAGGATLSGSGFNVQVTNTAGGAVIFDFSWIKL